MDMSNQFIISSSFYKIMMTTCSPKQPLKTMSCIICFPVPSLLVITYEVFDMACRSVLSNLNCIKRHLLIQFYSVIVTDIFVRAYCLVVFRYIFLCFLIVLFRFSFFVHVFSHSHHCHITRLSWCFTHIIIKILIIIVSYRIVNRVPRFRLLTYWRNWYM